MPNDSSFFTNEPGSTLADRFGDLVKHADLFDALVGYFYSSGFHIKGIYSLIIGFIFSASTIWNESLIYLQSYSWIIGAFVSSLTYYLLASK